MAMDEIEKEKMPPTDEVDFTSGYEKQYEKEYRPLQQIDVPPPNSKNAWYRDLKTICMIGFIVAIFLLGTVLLITLVATANPWKIFLIVATYVVMAVIVIFVEVKSVHFR